MKKIYLFAIASFILFQFTSVRLWSQAESKIKDNETIEEEIDDVDYVPNDIFKSFFFDAGYGANKFSFGLGVRYWNLGFSFGVAGIGESMPTYFYNGYEGKSLSPETAVNIEKYSSIHVCTDLYYFYDIDEQFTIFANLGYGVGTDSVFANHKDNIGTYNENRRYAYGAETESGLTYGLGVQYFFEKWIGLGIGYHQRRGVYAQFNYFWF